jgi:endonuclease VIII
VPEGHSVHRHARDLRADLAGAPVRVSSPQGRFAAEAEVVDGAVVERVEAYGKHLLVDLAGGATVHVHLGLRGLWLRYPHVDGVAGEPRKGVRLRLDGPEAAWDLIAPSGCALLDADGRARVLAPLGPDPLRDEADAGAAVDRLRGFRGPVGGALLDQGVWAGVGNAFRAELLFLHGTAPATPAAEVRDPDALWELTRSEMRFGVDSGHVSTVDHATDAKWVYKQEHCRRCGAAVESGPLTGRTAYRCPVDQV